MAEKLQAIRGMNDIGPQESPAWRRLEAVFSNCLLSYGYQEIRFPIVENTLLFKRSIGEVTDIVEKEMYTFADLNGDSLTLRPEGTAGCLRACLEHGLLYNQAQKLWYMGPMFRHERPQKGRYRQFHQFGVEAIGIDGTAIELELIALTKRIAQDLGIAPYLSLQINTIGELAERQHYKEKLVAFLTQHSDKLDEDCRQRLYKNPLRILDSKNPDIQTLLKDAPTLMDSLGPESLERFNKLCAGLDKMGIPFEINPMLVRGLDYYGHLVFEWVTDKLGSQATVCAGGRYDILVEQLGGEPTPAIGFAIGAERLLLLMKTLEIDMEDGNAPPSLFVMATSEEGLQQALLIAEDLRNISRALTIITNTTLTGLKSQFKKADKSGASLAIVLGDSELQNQQVSIKNLRKQEDQVTIAWQKLPEYLIDYFGLGLGEK